MKGAFLYSIGKEAMAPRSMVLPETTCQRGGKCETVADCWCNLTIVLRFGSADRAARVLSGTMRSLWLLVDDGLISRLREDAVNVWVLHFPLAVVGHSSIEYCD